MLGAAVAVPSVTTAVGRAAVLAVVETAHAGSETAQAGRVLAGTAQGHVAGGPGDARAIGSHSAGVVRIDGDRTRELDHTPDQVLTGPVGTATSGSVPFAYAGDSITARPGSWLRDLATDPAVHAVTGYAHSGYRADQVRALMPAVRGAAVLVVELGTNDVNQAVPAARTLASIDTLVARVGAPHVLVVDTPPSDHTTTRPACGAPTGGPATRR
jgi:hypothetical protein